jgi:hypothetical protein
VASDPVISLRRSRRHPQGSRGGMDSRLRQRAPGTPGRVGRGDHRHAGPVSLAEGHAGHRPPERPHPGAQLRLTDPGGHRFTCFATSTTGGQLADLELRHRRRARCEDRIRCAKDTGLRNLPLHGFAQNQIWCEIVALACELLAWMQMLAFTGPARSWEPKRLRLRIFAVAGRLVRGGRRLRLRLAARWPWTAQIIAAITRLYALASG